MWTATKLSGRGRGAGGYTQWRVRERTGGTTMRHGACDAPPEPGRVRFLSSAAESSGPAAGVQDRMAHRAAPPGELRAGPLGPPLKGSRGPPAVPIRQIHDGPSGLDVRP